MGANQVRRLLVNDMLTAIPGTRTFWHDLQEWFSMEFVGGDYATLAEKTAASAGEDAFLIIRNATWFPPIKAECPQIALLQDIASEGPMYVEQMNVAGGCKTVVFNSEFTQSKYTALENTINGPTLVVIPLPVDFSVFEPQNTMGCQQALGLPDGCVLWVGACQGAAGHVKGWDIFLSIVRQNPDIPFVAVFKDDPEFFGPPNLRIYKRLSHEDLVQVIGACRVGLCTSRMESQHLAGIEMGACGLPVVAPPVGVYWNRMGLPGALVTDPADYSRILRATRSIAFDPDVVRAHWQKEFDRPIIKAQWEKLVQEVEGE